MMPPKFDHAPPDRIERARKHCQQRMSPVTTGTVLPNSLCLRE